MEQPKRVLEQPKFSRTTENEVSIFVLEIMKAHCKNNNTQKLIWGEMCRISFMCRQITGEGREFRPEDVDGEEPERSRKDSAGDRDSNQ